MIPPNIPTSNLPAISSVVSPGVILSHLPQISLVFLETLPEIA